MRSYQWVLNLTTQRAAVDYNGDLAVSRDLEHRINKVGVNHGSYENAAAAAEYISANPLVVSIEVTKRVTKVEGVWRNGRKYKE
jgi:hypothetical protein